MVISLVPAASAAGLEDTGMKSGDLKMEKLTREETAALLKENPTRFDGGWYEVEPSVSAPFSAGRLTGTALSTALNRLNALRRIAGVPEVALDDDLNELGQYAAVLLASADTLVHTLEKAPDGMVASFFKKASDALSKSNMHRNTLGSDPDHNVYAVDDWANDPGASNLDRLGHRRWLFNPDTGKVGFGYASLYFTNICTDRSGTAPSYDFISWPASGNFPSDLLAFENTAAWSITLNPDRFTVPAREDLTVTLTEERTGRRFVLSGTEEYAASDTGAYLGVDTGWYGVNNCIIFRPGDVEQYIGPWTVSVSGIRDRKGKDVDFRYRVDFFRSSPEPSFTDIPESHWAFTAIQYASDIGLLNGPGDGTFDGSGLVSIGQFAAMLTRSFYSSEVSGISAAGTPWYSSSMESASRHGLLTGTQADWGDSGPNDSITRCDMAQMTYNLLKARGQLPEDTGMEEASRSIPDWSRIPARYRKAAAVCTGMKILMGIDSAGTFGGENFMTRSEAAMIMCRLLG